MTTFALQSGTIAAASASRLLDLFAPTKTDRQPESGAPDRDLASLWRVDAIHRANNMAQLSTSLANIVTDRPDRWGAAEAAAPARTLARSYEVLALDNDSVAHVPCLDMITTIASGLTTVFGHARNIEIEMTGSEVFATPGNRRALTLMCSELVINALKYAFPADGPGMIAVAIGPCPDGIELTVADNGIGLQGDDTPGQGSRLLERLAHVSGATLRRSTVNGKTGLRVIIKLATPTPVDERIR